MSIPTLAWLRDRAEIARLDGLIRDPDLDATLAQLTANQEPPAPARQVAAESRCGGEAAAGADHAVPGVPTTRYTSHVPAMDLACTWGRGRAPPGSVIR
ncbi:MAG TPA: hypothetical protein VMV92_40335 [Streptosporangiaceae bacterium]|nr:hypothetical protein [Streptosporangiaceae bacterium]